LRKLWIIGLAALLLAVVAGGTLAHNFGGENSLFMPGRTSEEDDVSYRIENGTVVLSWGEKPTGGYAITIEETSIEEGDLNVYYSLRSPGPDEIVTQAITYPEDSAEIPGEFEEVNLVLLEEK